MRVRFAATELSPDAASAYNEVMSKVAAPVMEAISSLRDQTNGYSWAKLVLLGPIYGGVLQAPESTRVAIHSALNTLDTRMRQLDASRANVLSGALPLNKWISAVSVVFDGVKTQARDLGESTILSESVATFTDSIAQAKEWLANFGAKLGTGLEIGLPIIAIAAILLGIAVVPRLLGGGGTTVVIRDRGLRGPTLNGSRSKVRGRRLF